MAHIYAEIGLRFERVQVGHFYSSGCHIQYLTLIYMTKKKKDGELNTDRNIMLAWVTGGKNVKFDLD